MDKVEIQREIRRLEKKLNSYREQLENTKKISGKLQEYASVASQKKTKVENAFSSMLKNAKSRSAKLPPNSKYRSRYDSKMNNIFKGKNAANAVDSLQRLSSKARNGIINKDSENRELTNKINITQRKIQELKNELNKGDK